MKNVEINKIKYEIIVNYREGFVIDEVESKLTDYFEVYDYVLGDWAYGKLRLKGFYDEKNPKATSINNYKNVNDYLQKFCATNCRYFIIKKID